MEINAQRSGIHPQKSNSNHYFGVGATPNEVIPNMTNERVDFHFMCTKRVLFTYTIDYRSNDFTFFCYYVVPNTIMTNISRLVSWYPNFRRVVDHYTIVLVAIYNICETRPQKRTLNAGADPGIWERGGITYCFFRTAASIETRASPKKADKRGGGGTLTLFFSERHLRQGGG